MQKLFPQAIPDDILFISNILNHQGFEIKLVGGAVRDALRNQRNIDFDLATSASPDQVEAAFKPIKNCFIVPTGLAHGTVTLVLNNKHYEITTYRLDGFYSDNRHPDCVEFTHSIEEDLSRRDFTINAISADPITKMIHDPFHGREDIKNKIIRTVGDPMERFREDALRMIRACRFAATLGFSIEKNTFDAIRKLSQHITAVSHERIRDELLKMLCSDRPSIGFEAMRTGGLLEYILPELLEGYGVEQNEFHRYDVYTHNCKTCDLIRSEDPITKFAALLHDVGKPRAKNFALKIGNGNVFYNHEIIGAKMTDKIMKRLKFSNEQRERAVLLVEMHMFYYTKDWTDGAIRRFLRRFDGDQAFLRELFFLREADRLGSGTKKQSPHIFQEFKKRIDQILEEDAALKIGDLHINGNVLIEEFNLKPSPLIGEILRHLLELVLDDPALNNEHDLHEQTRTYLRNIEVQ